MKIACKMKYLLLLIAILLISCAGTQYKVDTSRLKNLDDFSEAKDLLAMNFSNFAKDSNRNVVNYATEYLEQANEIQAKLSTIDSNMVFNSVEETELLMLSMVSNARYYEPSNNEESLDSITELSPTDSIVNTFLQAIDNHSNNIEKQKTKKIIKGEITRTKKTIAESIDFEATKRIVSSRAFSDEEKDIMLLYSQYLLIKYNFNFSRYLCKIKKLGPFDLHGDEWFDANKQNFLQKYPNTKYVLFLNSIQTAIEDRKEAKRKERIDNIWGALLSLAAAIALSMSFITLFGASPGLGD